VQRLQPAPGAADQVVAVELHGRTQMRQTRCVPSLWDAAGEIAAPVCATARLKGLRPRRDDPLAQEVSFHAEFRPGLLGNTPARPAPRSSSAAVPLSAAARLAQYGWRLSDEEAIHVLISTILLERTMSGLFIGPAI
jgi:hypothetical protein